MIAIIKQSDIIVIDVLIIWLQSTIIEGSLEVKLPTKWTDEKQRLKGSERREE
jgi:hypothetical protein